MCICVMCYAHIHVVVGSVTINTLSTVVCARLLFCTKLTSSGSSIRVSILGSSSQTCNEAVGRDMGLDSLEIREW